MSVPGTEPVIPTRALVVPGEKKPIEVSATVAAIARRAEHGLLGPVIGLDVHLRVEFEGGAVRRTYFLSRLVGESYWVIDAKFGANAFPFFSNGFGARYLRTHGIARELEALLDEAARVRGLAAQIGPNLPLVLADPPAGQTPTATGVAS